ncbi:hypothetical protein J6590_040178 [Homalodisca vitripennis]|nr:hypothetical protein J6590_040178 [Homalodisca vitripennis]
MVVSITVDPYPSTRAINQLTVQHLMTRVDKPRNVAFAYRNGLSCNVSLAKRPAITIGSLDRDSKITRPQDGGGGGAMTATSKAAARPATACLISSPSRQLFCYYMCVDEYPGAAHYPRKVARRSGCGENN